MTNAVAAAWLSAAVSVSVLLTGCDTTRPEEQPAYVKASAVEERVDRIEQQNHALIDMQHHVEVLEADVRRLRGEIEEANHELGSVRAQDREIHADFDKRLSAAEARATAAAAAASAAVSAQVTSEPAPAATPVVPTSADREAYQTAFEQLKARDYVAAEKSFKGFISRFPNSSYVDNAEYWLGETYYVGKRYGEALDIFVRMLKDLVKDPGLGTRIVPIIPDEARTFGMDSLFPTLKIYSPNGQQYAAVDRELMLSYKESTTGVILHEGINEAGSVASFTAVGSSYSTHDEPMIPIYIFYSMFGFQRTGDAFWAAADQLVRCFVFGATAGRTTLNGEGLQHEDGHSPLLASTNPAVVSYDPAFAFELGHIVKDGLRRMYGENSENIYYYVTVYNEPYVHPAEPENLDVEGLLKGIYLYSPAAKSRKKSAQILASGVGVNWALKAQQLLADDWGVKASVWSVTSWNELRRDGLETDRHNLLNPKDKRRAYISKKLDGYKGPVIAISDYMRSVQDQVAPWVDAPFYSLGTDGFGLSDTRGALRRHFKVDAESIAVAVLQQLSNQGDIRASVVTKAMEKYRIDDVLAADAGNTEGSG